LGEKGISSFLLKFVCYQKKPPFFSFFATSLAPHPALREFAGQKNGGARD
jgi:hypothetical protein